MEIMLTMLKTDLGIKASTAYDARLTQLLTAAAIEGFGWMGQEKTAFGIRQLFGMGMMLGGIVLFKLH